jgi:hypothetical protein
MYLPLGRVALSVSASWLTIDARISSVNTSVNTSVNV